MLSLLFEPCAVKSTFSEPAVVVPTPFASHQTNDAVAHRDCALSICVFVCSIYSNNAHKKQLRRTESRGNGLISVWNRQLTRLPCLSVDCVGFRDSYLSVRSVALFTRSPLHHLRSLFCCQLHLLALFLSLNPRDQFFCSRKRYLPS